MSRLRGAVEGYLSVRRALGFTLVGTERLLSQFAGFAETVGVDTVTTEVALRWATLPPGRSMAWYAQRLAVVRCFARWLQAIDPATVIPPTDLPPCQRSRRITPYLYSDSDVAALLTAAGALPSPLTAATMQTFIGLLFATGLRRGEALGLDREDLNPATGVLSVRAAKFGKPRQLPLHPSAVAALSDYAARRDRWCPHPRTGAVFVSGTGARLSATTVSQTFRDLLGQTGIAQRAPGRPSRIHDARHTFAVNTLLGWYRDGGDVQARLPLLSTWLGHTDPRHTYWYLQAAPELLALAAQRLEQVESRS
ncbi:MAG: tyrosine-type recombinase/integrase [Dermatophilaceae bacterium]